MKKLKLFLAAAMLIGIGSAFTTIEPKARTTAYGFDAIQSQWVEVDRSLVNIQFRCIAGNEVCLYEEPNFDHPIGDADEKFELLAP